MKVKSLSPVRLLATPWTAAYQAPPSMGFSRQEYWSGVPLPSPVVFPTFFSLSLVSVSRGSSPVTARRLITAVASLVVEQGLWGAPASAVRSLQLPGSRAQAQQLWCMGLVAPWREGSSQIRDGTPVSCTDRRILYH